MRIVDEQQPGTSAVELAELSRKLPEGEFGHREPW
jgi:hypothetical protein